MSKNWTKTFEFSASSPEKGMTVEEALIFLQDLIRTEGTPKDARLYMNALVGTVPLRRLQVKVLPESCEKE